MASSGSLVSEPANFSHPDRPTYYIGQHDSNRINTLTEIQHEQLLNSGFNWMTSPITNQHFCQQVADVCKSYLKKRDGWRREGNLSAAQMENTSLPALILPTLSNKDTTLSPSSLNGSSIAYSSAWIDLTSSEPLISSVSRQILNMEVAYASFCGVRAIIIPGPRHDKSGRGVALFSRAIQEALQVAARIPLIIHMPMYREPGLDEKVETLSAVLGSPEGTNGAGPDAEIDLFSTWDSWHTIRSVCKYSARLFVGIRLPGRSPEKKLQERWFAEPMYLISLGPETFQENSAGHPSLVKSQQAILNDYMRLRNAPSLLLYDVGPESKALRACLNGKAASEFPSLDEARSLAKGHRPLSLPVNPHLAYMRWLERQQVPYGTLETHMLTSFQDWLQSPLQPLSDNLESSTYEMFESDPVKYDQYERAAFEAMTEWKVLKKPTSSLVPGQLVVAVAGAGRGPLVACILRAAERTNTDIQLWALEKNQNAYVYLLRRNELEWGKRVAVVKTDMRDWEGPRAKDSDTNVVTKLDIVVSELLGSFGDNELSPECLDGVQRHIARQHGISIPQSYTAHLSPIATPRIHQDLLGRFASGDANVFETPWVTHLFAIDFLAEKGVQGHARFQKAWEFIHPVEVCRQEKLIAEKGLDATLATPGSGAMYGSAGMNEHNARHSHLTFVCRSRGVCHGLAGYFESVLYAPQEGSGREPIEISILPEQIDRKSKDMISWFPIFFPFQKPLYFPQDAELEVSIWRQTDDTRVWYEWMVEAYMWVGSKTRIKLAASELHSSRKVACMM